MSVSLATIYANVLKDLGLNSSDSTMQSRATRWVNKALDKALMYNPMSEFVQISNATISTVADTPTYSLPAGFMDLLHIRNDTSAWEIEIRAHGQFDRAHPDPSSETTDSPSECTLEFDIDNNVHKLRLAPIPDDVYTLYYTYRKFHPALSGSQDLEFDKFETALEDWAIWEGSLVVFPDNEYAQYRMELRSRANESMKLLSQFQSAQRPAPRNIPIQLKRGIYE